jgi:ornithine lipid ester-linked acyl 2-hydroxylase
VPGLRLSESVFEPPWNVGVAPTTEPEDDSTVTLCPTGEEFSKSIETFPAFAESVLVSYLSWPSVLAARLSELEPDDSEEELEVSEGELDCELVVEGVAGVDSDEELELPFEPPQPASASIAIVTANSEKSGMRLTVAWSAVLSLTGVSSVGLGASTIRRRFPDFLPIASSFYSGSSVEAWEGRIHMSVGESRKSSWQRMVELTIAVGERILAPIERFIGRRSLVGDQTFFAEDLFPWIERVERHWPEVREELESVLADREALPNFQDISTDQIEITDDDRWKTFFLYGYGFAAKLGVDMCPKTAALMRGIPGMTTAMFSILSPRKHILDHRGPYKGVLRYHLGLIVPSEAELCRIRVGEDIRHWEEGKSMVFDDTFNHEVWNDTDETRVVLFVDVLRPLPAPWSHINRLIVKAIGYSPFVLDAKRNQEAWETRFRERLQARAQSAAA